MNVKKFQQGGEMGATAPQEQAQAPVETQEAPSQGGMEEQIATIAQDIIQQMGPDGAIILAQTIIKMLQEGQQPQQPTFQRKGGMLIRKK